MVCTNCGDQGHNIKTCPVVRSAEEDAGKRGLRDSPRTPGDPAKIAKLAELARKLSPKTDIPPLPMSLGADGSADRAPSR